MATSVNNRIGKGGQVRQSFINGQMCGGNVQCQLPGCLVLNMYHVKVSSMFWAFFSQQRRNY